MFVSGIRKTLTSPFQNRHLGKFGSTSSLSEMVESLKQESKWSLFFHISFLIYRVILRNYIAENAIKAAEKGDYTLVSCRLVAFKDAVQSVM